MQSIYNILKDNIGNEFESNNVFYFDGEQIKALAFKQGCKCDCIKKIKDIIKNKGFKYDYDFDAYIFTDKKNEKYRSEKNSFITLLIEWKITKTKTSNNEKNTGKLFFQRMQ
jgi:hypothetical protein